MVHLDGCLFPAISRSLVDSGTENSARTHTHHMRSNFNDIKNRPFGCFTLFVRVCVVSVYSHYTIVASSLVLPAA